MNRHATSIRTGVVVTGSLALMLAMAAWMPAAAAASPAAKFRYLDSNRDGFVSKHEVRRYPGYAQAFAEADQDKDGLLGPDEFTKAEAVYERLQAALYLDDSVITAKVKSVLVRRLKSLDVSVETYRGQVLLSGFVTSERQRDAALKAAALVEGVQGVRNGLVVK